MSSNIEIQRICEYCNKEFTARTTKTKYCSHKCNQRHYKAKEFLTIIEVATLLNCSTKTIYRHIDKGNIKAVNLGQRLTRVKRSSLDKIFS